MNRRHVRLRDGTLRALTPGELVPDGATVFASLIIKDAITVTDREQSDAAYETMKRDLSHAWKLPLPEARVDAPSATTVDEAHRAMVKTMQDAWR
jgi:hypothetical protein